MKPYRPGRTVLIPALGLLALSAQLSPPLQAQMAFRQANLVSDVPGMAAHTDSRLVNPWGISSGPTTPFWISNNGSDTSTLHLTNGRPLPLVVSTPAPTGQAFNTTTGFNGDRFIFANEGGKITGWRGALGTTAETLADNSATGASYLGVAVGGVGTANYVYAANFAQKRIDVIRDTGAPALPGSFADPSLPTDFSPFNIQNVGGSLYVAYAKLGADGDEVKGAGLGYVNKFDLNGNLLMRVASSGALNAPWAVTVAPAGFGKFAGDLLVGNFGDGTVNVFDPTNGNLIDTLKDEHGNPLVIQGLWGLQFGNGAAGGRANSLYFAAGIQDETHGLFGSLTPVPEPAVFSTAAAAGLLALCGWVQYRRRRKANGVEPAAAA